MGTFLIQVLIPVFINSIKYIKYPGKCTYIQILNANALLQH